MAKRSRLAGRRGTGASTARSAKGGGTTVVLPRSVLPTVKTNGRQRRDLVADAWRVLLLGNEPPRLFQRCGRLVQLAGEPGSREIEELTQAATYGLLIRAADWLIVTKSSTRASEPPAKVVRDLVTYPHKRVPELESVLTSPVLGPGPRLIDAAGYHEDARVVVDLTADATFPRVPDPPTSPEVRQALRLLTDDLLFDYPLVADSDRAHAVALLLGPFLTSFIDAPTPYHLVEAVEPGTGKGLLAECASLIATGHPAPMTVIPASETETEYKITALLRSGPRMVVLDNAGRKVDSPTLASVITSQTFQGRIVRTSDAPRLPNRATWVITGNNVELSLEMARRVVRVRLDPIEERPWHREGFRHPQLLEWVHNQRGALVRAALTLIQAWVSAGMPEGKRTLGSFERWSRVLGGVLDVAGLPGFLCDRASLYDDADAEARPWRAFVPAWWAKHQTTPVSADDLVTLAAKKNLLDDVFGEAPSRKAMQIRVGTALQAMRGRVLGGHRIRVVENKHRGSNDYALEPV